MKRRELLKIGLASGGLSSIGTFSTPAESTNGRRHRGCAKSVIVMYCWGGMSHLDTFDMKPHAGTDIRSSFDSIATSVSGYRICEHLPLMARHMHEVAVVRSVNHGSADHRKAAYWNLTGHMPTNALGGVVAPQLPSRNDWPSIGAQVAIAMQNDKRFQRVKQVKRLRPDEVVEDRSRINWNTLQVERRVSLSSDVLGPGHFPVGSFDHQDGYTNKNTVELIGMMSASSAASSKVTRSESGPRCDFSKFVFGDATAGDWGSDTHGRGGNLWLIGDSVPDAPSKGFGCHANKFITFNLAEVRKRHFENSQRPFVLTCRAGINGHPGVHENAAGKAGVWLDGKLGVVTSLLRRDNRSQKLEVVIGPDIEFITLAMLNGDSSTFYDDIALVDVDLCEVEGELPEPVDESKTPASRAVSEDLAANLPRTISIPYPLADRGMLNGQFGGFLGLEYDPVFVHPGRGDSFKGVSPSSGTIDLTPRVSQRRLAERNLLLRGLDRGISWAQKDDVESRTTAAQDQAINMLLSPEVQSAFDLGLEDRKTHELYGDHIAGQGTLLARRLTDAGVPLVTVNLSAGDLNGAQGDHWDTHGDNFNRLKNDLLPRWDRASSALLTELVQTGRIADTLVVFLTEFGRTPKINGNAGRDHFPNCYSVLFAGAGVHGGLIYGKSDKIGAKPIESACTPADIHATIFDALGIPRGYQIYDAEDRPLIMCEGTPLPIMS